MEELERYLEALPNRATFFAMAMTGAERMRRLRERRRWGAFVIPLPLTQEVLQGLVEQGHLSSDSLEDAEALGFDLHMILATVAGEK